MKVSVSTKKGAKQKASEEVEALCIKKFDFSIGELNELYDVIDDCDGLITYYLETTSSFSESLRKRIMGLALRKDNLIIDIDELYMLSSEFINLAKREYHTNDVCNADKKDVEEFQTKLKTVRKEIKQLLRDIRTYINEIKEYKAAKPY